MTTAIAFCESDIDPFDEEFLADPLPRLAQLRDLGPVVYLSRYDAHAVARYADVHRALTDWQSLQSGAGVGLSNFNHEEPWRPPSLLLEADPPRHDAPRHVLQQILSPRRLRALSDRWRSDAEQVVDDVLGRGDEFDAVTENGEVFPSGSSPMPSVSHAQAPLMVRSLLTAGVDTTVTGIAAVLAAVATRQQEWARLRADRSLVPRAFEEAVRWEPPVQTFFRTTTTPTRIAGSEIAPERKVLMFLGSADHDPRKWADPDRYDLTRDPSGHVGFGMGLHQCVGQHVARFEAMAVLDALLDRVAEIEPAGPVRRHLNNTLRGYEALPVRAARA